MASMTASAFLGGSAVATAFRKVPNSARGGAMVVRASGEMNEESTNNAASASASAGSRRELMFGMAAAAACSVAKVAMAEELKRGSPEAKKKYASVCVTNPTARICRY